jgi:TonB family protein
MKQQPVALEVAVTVNGARTIDGSAKREPFSETTKTVLVFGSGAVIRLTSSVAPGQLLFLTNERSKKEVVCQVVKSKNYRNVSGYVELEFTEPAVGFWGMRFPGDRIGSAPQPAPVAIPPAGAPGVATPKPAQPVAHHSSTGVSTRTSTGASIVPPAIDSASLLSSAKAKPIEAPALVAPIQAPPVPPVSAVPELPAERVAAESAVPTSPVFELARASDAQASIFASTPQTLQGPANIDLSRLTPFFEVKEAVPEVAPPPAPPAAHDPETEELKQHTARLQEQLSSMLFVESEASVPAKAEEQVTSVPFVELAAPLVKMEQPHDRAAEILETPNSSLPAPLVVEPDEPKNSAPAALSSSLEALEQEELKIPAWLEPLARNATAPTSTQELVLREKTKRVAERSKSEEPKEIVADLVAPVRQETVPEPRMPEFGAVLPIDEPESSAEGQSKGSGRGMLLAAIAAGILVVAGGGWWYMNQQSAGVHAGTAATPAPAASVPTQPSQSQPQREATIQENSSATADSVASHTAPAQSTSPVEFSATTKPSSSVPASSSTTPARGPQTSPSSPNGGKVVTTASAVQPEPVPAQVKKPVLGEVRLAAPKVAQNRKSQSVSVADAGNLLNDAEPESSPDSLGAGLVAGNNGPVAPAAPLPTGGDVKQAKLVSKVDPVYPTLAKNQHVSGNVTVDALIDASGRVTTMKIVSGPTLLHQAAMDALKQWKYQPATLDGKAVPMHLTVTLQFRLQ